MLDILDNELNVSETRKRMYKFFKRYKQLLSYKPMRDMPKVTQNLSFIAPTTNKDLNAVEVSADRNIKREKMLEEREELIKCVNQSLDHLDDDQRQIIEMLLELDSDKPPDVFIFPELGISRTKYYEIKQQAIINMAMHLGLEVYND